MTLTVGQPAPDFTLKTQDEKDWKLSDHRGKNVVLMWYPLDWSPTCETENCKVSTQPILEGKDVVVVGISRDSTWSHKAWKKQFHIKHDLLADPMLAVTKQYGVVHPAQFISHRATVVVDKKGNVAYYQIQSETPAEREWKPIQACLAQLA